METLILLVIAGAASCLAFVQWKMIQTLSENLDGLSTHVSQLSSQLAKLDNKKNLESIEKKLGELVLANKERAPRSPEHLSPASAASSSSSSFPSRPSYVPPLALVSPSLPSSPSFSSSTSTPSSSSSSSTKSSRRSPRESSSSSLKTDKKSSKSIPTDTEASKSKRDRSSSSKSPRADSKPLPLEPKPRPSDSRPSTPSFESRSSDLIFFHGWVETRTFNFWHKKYMVLFRKEVRIFRDNSFFNGAKNEQVISLFARNDDSISSATIASINLENCVLSLIDPGSCVFSITNQDKKPLASITSNFPMMSLSKVVSSHTMRFRVPKDEKPSQKSAFEHWVSFLESSGLQLSADDLGIEMEDEGAVYTSLPEFGSNINAVSSSSSSFLPVPEEPAPPVPLDYGSVKKSSLAETLTAPKKRRRNRSNSDNAILNSSGDLSIDYDLDFDPVPPIPSETLPPPLFDPSPSLFSSSSSSSHPFDSLGTAHLSESMVIPLPVKEVYVWQRSDEELEAIDQLRILAQDDPNYDPEVCDDCCLLRFLKSRAMQPDKALLQLQKYLAWRKDFSPQTIKYAEIEEAAKKRIAFYHFKNKAGEPTIFLYPARHNPQTRDLNQFVRFVVFVADSGISAMKPPNEKFSLVMDYTGFSRSNSDLELFKKLIAIFQDCYPERLGAVYLVKPPFTLNLIWNVVKPWLDKRTVEKVNFVDKPVKLFQFFDPEALPASLGGTSNYEPDDFFGIKTIDPDFVFH